MTSVCPAGQTPATVYGHAGFEAGLPFADYSGGFAMGNGPDAPEGSAWASSSLAASEPVGRHILHSNHVLVPQSGNVYLSFAYKGDFVNGFAGIDINLDGGILTSSPTWEPVILDITSQATTSGDGTVDVHFNHLAAQTTPGFFQVDDVTMYSCAAPVTTPPPLPPPPPPAAPAPNSRVRGDWSGQGTVDLMATRTDGTLWMYEGAGAGRVGRGVQVGSGWSTFTWQGSPGDINGDGRTDLLARSSDGILWYYPGKGNGVLGRRIQVGNGWNVMSTIATPGDFDRDTRPDVVARRADGTLHLYRILPTGALRYVRQIGNGWNSMTSIIGMGDLNADKRGDLLAVRSDGTLFSYLSTGTGLARGTTVTTGWNIMTKLTSPGDMNKDGRGDLIARRSDGTLWYYAGRTGGGVLSGKQVGTGWNVMSNIL
jgi:hypothetical protein